MIQARITLFFLVTLFLVRCHGQEQIQYVGIPAGFDFPADQNKLLKYVRRENTPEMRLHTWKVFGGLTQPTQYALPKHPDMRLPIWETWYRKSAVFSPSGPFSPIRRFDHPFITPRQFETIADATPPLPLLSLVLFNQEAANHIYNCGYTKQATLTDLNNYFDQAKTPVANRNVADFDRSSIALKTAWWVVKKTGITTMPVWDGIPDDTPDSIPDSKKKSPDSAKSFPYTSWTRCVGVDPSNSPSQPVKGNCNGKTIGFRTVPLNQFYGFQIDLDQLSTVRASEVPGGEDAQIGDYVVLVGMHMITREIPNWVWASFWWHDKPNEGVFAQNRPKEVTGVWRNYLMTTAYSMTTPLDPDESPHSAFNPWLEAKFVNGVYSNCMNCHRQAAWLEPGRGAVVDIERGEIAPDDDRFKNGVKLSFIWSILFESQTVPLNGGASSGAQPDCLPQADKK